MLGVVVKLNIEADVVVDKSFIEVLKIVVDDDVDDDNLTIEVLKLFILNDTGIGEKELTIVLKVVNDESKLKKLFDKLITDNDVVLDKSITELDKLKNDDVELDISIIVVDNLYMEVVIPPVAIDDTSIIMFDKLTTELDTLII